MEIVSERNTKFHRYKVGLILNYDNKFDYEEEEHKHTSVSKSAQHDSGTGHKRGGTFKLMVSMALVLLVFVGVVAVATFFVAVRGAEQVLVPDVRGKELGDALLELQVKELYPRVQLRDSLTAADRGRILEQDPRPGAIVKAGRRINLVVSRGLELDRVENYVGRSIDEVRAEVLTLRSISTGERLVYLRDPIMFDYSPQPAGTILRQRPEPGASITGPIELELVVSRGPGDTFVTVPILAGLSIPAALEQISRSGIAFEFSIRETMPGEQGGTVVSQNPPAGTSISYNSVVAIVVNNPPQLGAGEVFGLFSFTMPRNPYPLPVRLDAEFPTGERVRLIGVHFQGGRFTAPYRLPSGSTLILSLMDRELHRRPVL